jgi:hypothetical protein
MQTQTIKALAFAQLSMSNIQEFKEIFKDLKSNREEFWTNTTNFIRLLEILQIIKAEKQIKLSIL